MTADPTPPGGAPPPSEPKPEGFSLRRLTFGHAVAALAAIALLFAMAPDWYTTTRGERAREIEEANEPRGAAAGEIARELQREARELAESQEKNAWQQGRAADRVLLVLLLLSVLVALAAAWLQAAGARGDRPIALSRLATLAGSVAAALLAYRLVQQPGDDISTTIRPAAVLALGALGILVIGSSSVLRSAQEEGG